MTRTPKRKPKRSEAERLIDAIEKAHVECVNSTRRVLQQGMDSAARREAGERLVRMSSEFDAAIAKLRGLVATSQAARSPG